MSSSVSSAEPVALDPGSREPLHAQLAGILRDQIRDRDRLPGESLPTETQLQHSYGVSRSVARQAMATLVAEGLVVRGRGRGSVVAPERQHRRIVNNATGLYEQLGATGAQIRTDILQFVRERAPYPVPVLGGREAIRLERLRSVDGTPTAFIRTWLPLELAAGIAPADLRDGSLHALLSARHGFRIVGGRRTVRAVAADLSLARLLGVHTGAPLLLLEGTNEASGGVFVEHFATWHRGDLIAFDLDARRPAARRPDRAGDATAEARRLLQRAMELLGEDRA